MASQILIGPTGAPARASATAPATAPAGALTGDAAFTPLQKRPEHQPRSLPRSLPQSLPQDPASPVAERETAPAGDAGATPPDADAAIGHQRETAPVGDGDAGETGNHAGDLTQKLADLSATLTRDRATAIASIRGDYSAQTRKIERLAATLAQRSEEFSRSLSRLRNLAERNAARLMAQDTATPSAAPDATPGRRAGAAGRAPRAGRRPVGPSGTTELVGRTPGAGRRRPLRLAAVEYRGQEPAAVVLLDGRRRSLHEGDALLDYRVSAISVAERALTLLEPATGKHYVLVVGTNYVAEYNAGSARGIDHAD